MIKINEVLKIGLGIILFSSLILSGCTTHVVNRNDCVVFGTDCPLGEKWAVYVDAAQIYANSKGGTLTSVNRHPGWVSVRMPNGQVDRYLIDYIDGRIYELDSMKEYNKFVW